ncbi:MAG: HEAT repeat domain-containing protein [Acidobacteriota bacterium]
MGRVSMCLGTAVLIGLLGPVGTAPSSAAESPATEGELPRLVEGLGGDRATRERVREQLLAHGADAVPHLTAKAEDPRFAVRWEVVNLLGYLESSSGIPTLVDRIGNDVDPHVRWRAMWALRRIPDPEGREALAARCAGEGTPAWNACVGLSLFEDPRALPRLLTGLGHVNGWIRWEAVDSLGRVHDGETSTHLIPLLEDPEPRVRQEAALSLAQIGDATAVTALVAALEAPSPEVRWRAAMGLGRCGDRSVLRPLEARLEAESDPQTRRHLAGAIDRLRSR